MFKSLSRGIFFSSLADPESCLNPKARRFRNLFIESFNNKRYTKRKPSYFQNHKGNSQEMFPKKSILKIIQNSQEGIRIRYCCYFIKKRHRHSCFYVNLDTFSRTVSPWALPWLLMEARYKNFEQESVLFNTVIFSFEFDSSVFCFENILASSFQIMGIN